MPPFSPLAREPVFQPLDNTFRRNILPEMGTAHTNRVGFDVAASSGQSFPPNTFVNAYASMTPGGSIIFGSNDPRVPLVKGERRQLIVAPPATAAPGNAEAASATSMSWTPFIAAGVVALLYLRA